MLLSCSFLSLGTAVALLHPLHGSTLTPRLKFAHPQTSAQEIGWLHEPLIKADREERRQCERFDPLELATERRHQPSEETKFADRYIAQNQHSPFVGAVPTAPAASSRKQHDQPLHIRGQPNSNFLAPTTAKMQQRGSGRTRR